MSVMLDISGAQLSALCDYSRGVALKYPIDFISENMADCTVCDGFDGATVKGHLLSSSHRKVVHEYNSCMHALNVEDRRCYALNHGPVSRREVVVAYLANRVLNADGVHGTERFHRATVAYLLHRMTVGGLLKAFQSVHGCERMVRNGMCVVCMERTTSMMFAECRHACTCINCAVRLRAEASSEDKVSCPVCRKPGAVVPLYIS